MRVVVYGAGAIGGLFGARLSRAHHEVLLIAREDDVVAIRLRGLIVEGPDGGRFDLPVNDALVDGQLCDALLLTVKTTGLRAAATEIARRLRPLPPLLALQNGLGVEEQILSALEEGGAELGPGSLTRAVNTVPATRLGPGRLRPGGEGEVILDSPDVPEARRSVELFRELFVSAGIAVRQVPELSREVWRKAIVNAAVNPVTADHNIPNGRLSRDPWRGQAEALLHEAQAVARAEGFEFSDDEVESDLWRVVRASAQNRSSMLQDLDRGRPTEIEAISGELLKRGERHALRLPHTRRAYDRIRARERLGRREPAEGGQPS